MKCPHLRGISHLSCKVTRDTYVPSRFEYEEFCTHNGYKICPLYIRAGNYKNPADTAAPKGVFSQAG